MSFHLSSPYCTFMLWPVSTHAYIFILLRIFQFKYFKVRERIAKKMEERFDVIKVDRCVPMLHVCIILLAKYFCNYSKLMLGNKYLVYVIVFKHIYTLLLLFHRPQSINDLTESLVVNLSLTGGNGFYQNVNKETLWTGRKMVIRDKVTGVCVCVCMRGEERWGVGGGCGIDMLLQFVVMCDCNCLMHTQHR